MKSYIWFKFEIGLSQCGQNNSQKILIVIKYFYYSNSPLFYFILCFYLCCQWITPTILQLKKAVGESLQLCNCVCNCESKCPPTMLESQANSGTKLFTILSCVVLTGYQ